MKHPLHRLFRLRSLLEDVGRLELESRLQELARIEGGLDRISDSGKASRRMSFEGFARGENSAWLEAEASGELAAWQRGLLETVQEKKLEEVYAARVEFLERRKERRQMESVIEAGLAEAAAGQLRREQRELDDWFNQERMRRGRARR